LREERRLRVFENRVLKRIFRPKRDEVTGEWRKLHNEELNDLYCSPNIERAIKIEKNEMGGACSIWGTGKDYAESTLRERYHLKDAVVDGNIILKTDLKEV
jgi:hypothetical protein